ncbi:MAG TPA: transposase [Pseudolabrys sp.]|nr:transposase [Pseudolabrys sp.]
MSLTYRATLHAPARFHKSKSVGAVFGLTCAKYQSGEVEWRGRISRCGDEMMPVMPRGLRSNHRGHPDVGARP